MFAKWILLVAVAMASVVGAADAQIGERARERIAERRAAESKLAPNVPGTDVITMQVGGETRTYRLHIPAGLPAGPAPLVISLHGLNSSAAQQESLSRFSALADQFDFIAAYPEGLNAKWRFTGRNTQDLDFLSVLIVDIQKRHPVATNRVMINGISNGAQMSWRAACDRPETFAAVGLVSGGYPNACPKSKHPPAIIFHGTSDKVLPYGGRAGQMPVPDFAAAWAGCPSVAAGIPVDTSGDATSVRLSCKEGAEVLFYTLEDKGHSWPGSDMPPRITSLDVDASSAMLDFMRSVGAR